MRNESVVAVLATVIKNLGIDVLEAAKLRIKNAFSNGLKIYLSVSGGKDSIDDVADLRFDCSWGDRR